jgi:hypothetical protein
MKIGFYSSLLKFAQRRAADMTDPGDEGCPAVTAKLQPITSNYPWIYIDYLVEGSLYLQELRRLEDSFRLFCEKEKASFQDLRISASTERPGKFSVRVKLVYREDLAR